MFGFAREAMQALFDGLAASIVSAVQALGAGEAIDIWTTTDGNYDCLVHNPVNPGQPARSIIVLTGTVKILDGIGRPRTLPDFGPRQWVGFKIQKIEAGGTASTVVIVW